MERNPAHYARLSIAASLTTIALKFGAWLLTDSVGLLSDATESLVNLAAGIMALVAIIIASRPADERHAYGHDKAEYFSSGAEGLFILLAAAGIVHAAAGRFLDPVAPRSLGIGLLLALAASAVNLLVARAMLRAAKRYDSIVLEADARHLLTDVWTSGGLVVGLSIILVKPGWVVLDPLIAVVMALNIAWTAFQLLARSVQGLMDHSLPEAEVESIIGAIRSIPGTSGYHGLRTRKSGRRRFVDFHLLVPGTMSVKEAHDLCHRVEDAIRSNLPEVQVTCHVEPDADPGSFDGDEIGGRSSA